MREGGRVKADAPALHLDAHFEDADAFYAALIEAHRGLTDEESQIMNARLVLFLANQIGARAVLEEALRRARDSVIEDRHE
jgi:hypothetical protein